VKRLETAGLVQRARDRADERLLAVTLTAPGRRLRKQAEQVPGKIVQRLGLPIAELEHLNGVLRTVIAAAAAT
jgi:DNA-binding MarR family transcriptional regulator